MAEGITTQSDLDHETVWRHMRVLVERLFSVLESETMIDDCLDILVDVLAADRGLILLTFSDGTTQAVNARGRKRALNPIEREEISKTIVREVLESGECVTWSPLVAVAPSSSMNILGITAGLAAPLYVAAGGHRERRGVLYVDFRDPRKFVNERHVEFFMSAALLLGAVLEQQSRSQVVREHLKEAESHCVEARRTPPLDDLLAPASLGAVRREAQSALVGDSPILILGESGTGKTLLAQAIAEASARRPIVRAVLGSSDDLNTITSELFGHQKGSYSGAMSRRIGLVEFADQGTLIFDEILNLPLHAQKLLLDFTQFGTYRPLGYDRPEPKRARVRVIAATNGDLRAAVRDGRFRLDLFHRLAAVTLEVPPLRRRREDIPALADGVLRRLDPARAWSLSVPLRRLLLSPAIEWSGNVRQLESVITRARERAVARDPEATVLTPEHIEPHDIDGASASDGATAAAASADGGAGAAEPLGVAWQRLQGERAKIDEGEQAVVRRALERANGVVAHAARELGIARTTLSSRIEALGLRPPRGRADQPPQ